MHDRQFQIDTRSILDLTGTLKFDVVLALNIFHHFIKDRRSHEKLLRLLSNVEAKVMFFEPHHPGEEQMKGSYRNYEPDEFALLVAGACRLVRQRIGQAPDGRPIYMLTKPGLESSCAS